MPPPSILTHLDGPGDTIKYVPDGRWSGGVFAHEWPETDGPQGGWRVVVSESFAHTGKIGGAVIDLAPPDASLPAKVRGEFDGGGWLRLQGVERLALVGFRVINGVEFIETCNHLRHAFCDWAYGVPTWFKYGPDPLHPGTGNYYDCKAGGPRPLLARDHNLDTEFLGSTIWEGGSGFTIGNGDEILLEGIRTVRIGEGSGLPSTPGGVGDPDDCLHADAIGITVGPLKARIIDSDLAVPWPGDPVVASDGRIMVLSAPAGGPNHGDIDLTMERVWARDSWSAGITAGSWDDRDLVKVTMTDVACWGYSPSGPVLHSITTANSPYPKPTKTITKNSQPTRCLNVENRVSYGTIPVGQSPGQRWRAAHPASEWRTLLGEHGLPPVKPPPPEPEPEPEYVTRAEFDALRVRVEAQGAGQDALGSEVDRMRARMDAAGRALLDPTD